MSYPVYPSYKDSGIEWLEQIPSHWNSVSLRWVSRRYAGGTPDKAKLEYWTDGTIPWINSSEVNQTIITEPSAFITEDAYQNSSAKWIAKGSLVIALAGQGKTKGIVAQVAIDTTCNQSMAAIIPVSQFNSRFLYWWLTSNYQKIRNMAGGDLRDGLNLEMIGNIPCPLLPVTEQMLIANFLDQETAKIDTLITKQQQLIETLREKRKALISHVVTKGLNPNTSMKDSGVGWLGKIPTHWNILAVKYFAHVGNGSTPNRNNLDYWQNGTYPWLTSGMIHGRYIEHANEFITDTALKECHLPLVKKNSILIAITGEGKTRGTSAIVTFPTTISQHLAYLTVNNSIVYAPFMLLYFLSQYAFLRYESDGSGSTRAALTCEYLRNFSCPIPPLDEQVLIADLIESKYQQFETLIQKTQRAIDLLQERRTSLISAAVTGKIDVRAYGNHAP